MEQVINDITAVAEGAGSGEALQVLTFRVGEEEYGIDLLKVQEIKGFVSTTRLPNSPPEMVGVLNLRGTIIPVVDLRTKFGMESMTYDQFAAIIVVLVGGQVMGMITEHVSEVTNIPVADIQPVTGNRTENAISGIGKLEESLVILLDVDLLLGGAIGAEAA